MSKFLEFFQKIWNLLPKDPFREYILEAASFISNQEWIGVLNYFVPISAFIKIGTAWLSAVTLYIIVRKIYKTLFGKG